MIDQQRAPSLPCGDELRQQIVRRLHRITMPAQYLGNELNSVTKDLSKVDVQVVMAFPDTYTLGMSHHGLQVLYSIINQRPNWACERVFTPFPDFEKLLRELDLPLYTLETFTPLCHTDVIGFSCSMKLDTRTSSRCLISAGFRCSPTSEPMIIR